MSKENDYSLIKREYRRASDLRNDYNGYNEL